jgi:Ca2+-binding EF-hand superfamily protein
VAVVDESRYADAFALIDADGNGTITAGELVRLMTALGDDVTPEAADKAVELMDTDGDGEISLAEFAQYLATRAPAS